MLNAFNLAGPDAVEIQAWHLVVSNESLTGLAKTHYGDADTLTLIFDANRDVLDDPDDIFAGQILRFPKPAA